MGTCFSGGERQVVCVILLPSQTIKIERSPSSTHLEQVAAAGTEGPDGELDNSGEGRCSSQVGAAVAVLSISRPTALFCLFPEGSLESGKA